MAKERDTRADLVAARDDGAPVRLRRKLVAGKERLDAVVLQVGRRWTVTQECLDGQFVDGYVLVRTRDVTAVDRATRATRSYVARVMGEWGAAVPFPVEVGDMKTSEMLDAVSAAFPLLGFSTELVSPDAMYVGEVGPQTKKWFAFQPVDPQGRWGGEPYWQRRAHLTRVDVGGRYMDALATHGNPAPVDWA